MRQFDSDLKLGRRRPAWPGIALALGVVGLLAVVHLPTMLAVNANYVRLNHALIDQSSSSLGGAREGIATSLTIYPTSGPLLRLRALASSALGGDQTALADWRNYPAGAQEVRAWAKRAEKVEDWEQAAYWYKLVTELEPDSADDWYQYGQVLTYRGELQTAREAFQSGLAIAADSQLPRSSDFLTQMGALARQDETPDWNGALALFTEAIEQDAFAEPNNRLSAHMGRAEAADQLGLLSQALADYLWVADRQDNNYWAHVHSGRLTWYLEQDAGRAAALLEQAVAIDPENKWAYLNLAQVFAGSGQGDRAIELLEAVLSNAPRDEDIQARLEELRSGQ